MSGGAFSFERAPSLRLRWSVGWGWVRLCLVTFGSGGEGAVGDGMGAGRCHDRWCESRKGGVNVLARRLLSSVAV